MTRKSKGPRRPQPFFREFTGTWYVQLGKRQINLGPDKAAAWEQYHQIMASREAMASATLAASTFFEAYLDWVSRNRAPATYRSATHYLTSFVRFLGKRKQLRHVTADAISGWLDEHTSWGSTTRSDAISHLSRAFAWGMRKKVLKHSPVADLEKKPTRRRREVVYSPAEWKKILGQVKDECFRDLLIFMWETGCRPIEARRLEAAHVDLKNELALYQPSESKTGTFRPVFLTETAKAICERLCKLHPEGPIFRNSRGRPWTKDAIKCRFTRLKEKVGINGLCAYGIRHSYATEALKNGVDSVSLAVLMGHKDVSMIARNYQHLAKNIPYLREQAKRARSSGA